MNGFTRSAASKWKSYPKYKDSGVEWLGKVPEDWEKTKIKFIAKFQTGWTPPTGKSELFKGDNLWANISDLGPKLITDTAKRISDDAVQKVNLSVSPKGSLLFSFKLSIGQVSFAGCDLYTNEAIATFLEGEDIILGYLYYALPVFVVQNASENIYGAKLLNQELIRSANIVLPGVKEQVWIASFLDRETSKIDTLIAKSRRSIELLQERRKSLISAAVTGKIDVREAVT